MSGEVYSIGEMARLAGCKVQTVRYYEEIGLLPQAHRSKGNQRRYDRAGLNRLVFVRHGRELGFGTGEIRELLALADQPEQSCEAADAIARKHLASVEQRIKQLSALRVELQRMIAQCRGGEVSDCRIVESIADHGLCQTDHS